MAPPSIPSRTTNSAFQDRSLVLTRQTIPDASLGTGRGAEDISRHSQTGPSFVPNPLDRRLRQSSISSSGRSSVSRRSSRSSVSEQSQGSWRKPRSAGFHSTGSHSGRSSNQSESITSRSQLPKPRRKRLRKRERQWRKYEKKKIRREAAKAERIQAQTLQKLAALLAKEANLVHARNQRVLKNLEKTLAKHEHQLPDKDAKQIRRHLRALNSSALNNLGQENIGKDRFRKVILQAIKNSKLTITEAEELVDDAKETFDDDDSSYWSNRPSGTDSESSQNA